MRREIDLKKADYFHKGFLTNFSLLKRIPIVTYFVFLYQNAITETKQVEPLTLNALTLMVSTKSAHQLPDNSREAFNSFYCNWKPVKLDGSTLHSNPLLPRLRNHNATDDGERGEFVTHDSAYNSGGNTPTSTR